MMLREHLSPVGRSEFLAAARTIAVSDAAMALESALTGLPPDELVPERLRAGMRNHLSRLANCIHETLARPEFADLPDTFPTDQPKTQTIRIQPQ